MKPARAAALALSLAATLASLVAIGRYVRLSPDVSALLPDRGEAASLARYVRAFGGGDPGLVLLEGEDGGEVEDAAGEAAASLTGLPGVARVYDRVELPQGALTASQWFLLADPALFAELGRLTTGAGLRARLAETRALLLAPGGGALSAMLARDPLRLAQRVGEARRGSSSLPARSDGALATEDGRARLVVAVPRGNALSSQDARAFVADAEGALGPVRARHPGVSLRLTGGHAVAAATEGLLRRDLTLSSVVSLGLTSAVFLLLFRRPRALLAILPPLAAGTAVAAAAAAFFTRGLSSIAVAFASVVIGVGMDTGVHVYGAVREARAAGHPDPAGYAIEKTWRPVLGAALVAGSAFGCLWLSRVEALRQFGLLSAVGEVATALGILAFTPLCAAWLERGATAPGPGAGWARRLARAPGSRAARPLSLAALGLALLGLGVYGLPQASAGLAALRPAALEPHRVYQAISERFGTDNAAPWVVLVADRDPGRALARGDRLFEALTARPLVARSVDALSSWSPAEATLEARLAARRALDLPARGRELGRALAELGFAPSRFEPALSDLASPAPAPDLSPLSPLLGPRYLARDGGESLAALYVQSGDPGALEGLVREVDPGAMLTGYPLLETSLGRALAEDLPRVGLLSLALLTCALAVTLRRPRDIALALIVITAEIALVLGLMRLAGVPLHVFDALVLPVLLGITVDEVLFVLLAARRAEREGGEEAGREALLHEAPLVATTACTTAAGFGALLVCRFTPLAHLGMVGAAGSLIGLALALLVVPAWVLGPRPRGS